MANIQLIRRWNLLHAMRRAIRAGQMNSDEFYQNTVLLLQFEGNLNSPGGGNGNFVDKSYAALPLSQVANSGVASGGPYAGGQYHDGSANSSHSPYVDTAYASNFQFGTNDFTIEFWFNKFGAWHVNEGIMGNRWGGNGWDVKIEGTASGGRCIFRQWASNVVQFTLVLPVSAVVGTTDAWHHIAIVRDGNTVRGYLNGVQGATVDVTGIAIDGGNYRTYVGYSIIDAGYSDLDDVRITKGVCRYGGGTSFSLPSEQYPSS